MEREIWRQCVRWLIDTGVLPSQHKTAQSFAVVFDLAQTLRDGVVLCNLLNLIKPGAVDFNRINLRPQMLQVKVANFCEVNELYITCKLFRTLFDVFVFCSNYLLYSLTSDPEQYYTYISLIEGCALNLCETAFKENELMF